MNVTPSLPELARTQPELVKERVVLVKDSRTGEYCKNKIILKLVGIEELASSAKSGPEPGEEKKEAASKGAKVPVPTSKIIDPPSTGPAQPTEEETKLVAQLTHIIRTKAFRRSLKQK